MCLDWAESCNCVSAFAFCLFFSFFGQPQHLTKSYVNSAPVYCSRLPQIRLFSNFFIKNGSHSTIYTFKNYFATVFSISVFNFSKNKLNSNGPHISSLSHEGGLHICGVHLYVKGKKHVFNAWYTTSLDLA